MSGGVYVRGGVSAPVAKVSAKLIKRVNLQTKEGPPVDKFLERALRAVQDLCYVIFFDCGSIASTRSGSAPYSSASLRSISASVLVFSLMEHSAQKMQSAAAGKFPLTWQCASLLFCSVGVFGTDEVSKNLFETKVFAVCDCDFPCIFLRGFPVVTLQRGHVAKSFMPSGAVRMWRRQRLHSPSRLQQRRLALRCSPARERRGTSRVESSSSARSRSPQGLLVSSCFH